MSVEKRRGVLLRLPIGDLSAWHLVAGCPVCRQDRYVLIADLVARSGPNETLVALMPRLRCKVPECRQSPATVRLRNRFPVQAGPELIDVVPKEPGQSLPHC
jgi:hypothetical protein